MGVEGARNSQSARKQPYIPGLAAFRFRPDPDWTKDQAAAMYEERKGRVGKIRMDKIFFQDCIAGMKELPDESIDLIIADPPFGIDFPAKESLYNRDEDFVVSEYEEVNECYDDFTMRWISELPRIMKQDASAYIFSGWNNLDTIISAAKAKGLEMINLIIWHYQFGVFTQRKFVTSHYHLLLLAKDPKELFFHKIEHYPQDVWSIPRKYKPGQKKNGTVLPIEVVKKCIDFSSEPGDLILDPFMGNGTTAVAAKENYRHFLGFEINEKLEPVIRENLLLARVGTTYRPYIELLPSTETLRKKYPRAYRIYMKEEGKKAW